VGPSNQDVATDKCVDHRSEVFGHPRVAIPFCAQDGNAAVIG